LTFAGIAALGCEVRARSALSKNLSAAPAAAAKIGS
jgi:hypothetical protein